MSYRCLMIVNPARIRCKNEQLLIETERSSLCAHRGHQCHCTGKPPKHDHNSGYGGAGTKRCGDFLVR